MDSDEPKRVTVQVRMKLSGVARIDQLRGNVPRSEWIRQACAEAAANSRTFSCKES